MYLWQRLAGAAWWSENESDVQAEAGARRGANETPGRKQLIVQIASRSRAAANALQKRFGGRVAKLPRDWLKRAQDARRSEPLRIGKRLIITDDRTRPADQV